MHFIWGVVDIGAALCPRASSACWHICLIALLDMLLIDWVIDIDAILFPWSRCCRIGLIALLLMGLSNTVINIDAVLDPAGWVCLCCRGALWWCDWHDNRGEQDGNQCKSFELLHNTATFDLINRQFSTWKSLNLKMTCQTIWTPLGFKSLATHSE